MARESRGEIGPRPKSGEWIGRSSYAGADTPVVLLGTMPAHSLAIASASSSIRVDAGRRCVAPSAPRAPTRARWLGQKSAHAAPRGRAHSAAGIVTRAASAADAPPAIAPAHLRTTITPVPPEVAAQGGMLLADQPGMKDGFGDLTNHDFLRVNVDAPNLRVLNIDPPILTVDDFLTSDECDALIEAARSSGEMKVSAVGGTENQNIRTSKTCTLNSPALTDHPTKHAILAKAEALLPQLTGLSKSKGAFKAPTSGSPYSFELPQVAHYEGGEYFKTHEDAFPIEVAERKGYQRRATVLVYLNDVAEGGATSFDKIEGLDVEPRKGRMLLFFPGTKASMPDTRTLHTAREAVVGHEKWISQLWVCAYAGKHAPEGKPPGPGDRAARRAAEKAAKKAAKKSGGGGRK